MMDSIVLEKPSSSSTACSSGGGGDAGGGGGGGRTIDRHNPIIQDEKRLGQGRIFPSNSTVTITAISTADQPHHRLSNLKVAGEGGDQKRKSVAFSDDDEFIKAVDFISPASSSRCLLSDKPKFDFTSEFHHVPPPSPPPPSPQCKPVNSHTGKAFKKKDDVLPSSPRPTSQPPPSPPPSCTTPKPPSPPPASNQVVILEVSLHCRGCERKMKKHISKIQGVTSFNIEFAAKKMTVVGDVTPLAVLTSVLKVKNAKLLTPATISSSSS